MSTANTAVLPALATTGSDPRAKVAFKETPEAEVVRRAQGGDEAAFRQLVERHRTKVFSAIYGIVRRRNDAEDIAQQVFAKVYLSLKSFDFRSSLTTWIYRIAVNECYDYLRKQKVRKLVYESDLATDDARTIEDSSLAVARTPSAAKATEQRDFLMKLLEYISEDDRILLLQKEVEGLTIE